MKSPDWSGSSGDIWARLWRETDRALAPVGEALDAAILGAAPEWAFRALDVGCGPGTTALAIAAARSDAEILGCDLSEPLIAIARERAADVPGLTFVAEDAETAARSRGPFDLVFSRHGVMFFDDPRRAFRTLRDGVTHGAMLVFSCFQSWSANPWAGEIATAAADGPVPAPGREPSGFAFADPGYVHDVLASAGWSNAQPRSLDFDYVAGAGDLAVDEALGFLVELGPAARLLESMDDRAREAAAARMRMAIAGYRRAGAVMFPAAAWIWTATAG